MNSYINISLLILILFTLYYFNVLETYTPTPTSSLVITQSCKRKVEEQPKHDLSNHSNFINNYLVGNTIRGKL